MTGSIFNAEHLIDAEKENLGLMPVSWHCDQSHATDVAMQLI